MWSRIVLLWLNMIDSFWMYCTSIANNAYNRNNAYKNTNSRLPIHICKIKLKNVSPIILIKMNIDVYVIQVKHKFLRLLCNILRFWSGFFFLLFACVIYRTFHYISHLFSFINNYLNFFWSDGNFYLTT